MGRQMYTAALAVVWIAAWAVRSTSVVIRTGALTIANECGPNRRRKKKIIVDSLALVCDDESENYSYQNALTCQPGDRAKVAMNFRLVKIPSNFSLDIKIHTTVLGEISKVRNRTNLCQFKSLSYLGPTDDDMYTAPCPLMTGPYELLTSYTIPENWRNGKATPDLKIVFHDANTRELVGCVETGTLAMIATGRRNQKVGGRILILSVMVFVAMFAIFLFGHRRRRKADELIKANKQAAIIRRFHYKRTAHSRGNNNGLMMHHLNPAGSEGTSSPRSTTLQEVT